jgi:hypothetical protein
MSTELRAAAVAAGVDVDGLDDHAAAIKVLRAKGISPDDACSEHNHFTLASRGTSYLVMRACRVVTEGY